MESLQGTFHNTILAAYLRREKYKEQLLNYNLLTKTTPSSIIFSSQHSLNVSLNVFGFLGLPLIVLLLTAGERNLQLDFTSIIIDTYRHNCQPL